MTQTTRSLIYLTICSIMFYKLILCLDNKNKLDF